MPVRNAGTTIDRQLAALAAQDFSSDWELVVSDNGSSDDTLDRTAAWSDRLRIRTADAGGRRGVAHARNVGVGAAQGTSIAMCDGDDVAAPGWLRALAHALARVDLAAGPLELSALNPAHAEAWGGSSVDGPRIDEAVRLPWTPGGNLAFTRALFDAVGGFDVSLRRGEDLDFGWRALTGGASFAFVPGAVVHVRTADTVRRNMRNGFDDGLCQPLLYRRYGDEGLERESRARIALICRQLLVGVALPAPRRFSHRWAYDVGERAGRLAGSIRYRTVFL